jgi:hypothetical protein
MERREIINQDHIVIVIDCKTFGAPVFDKIGGNP